MRRRRSRRYIYGRGITRPYVNKRNRLMLGSGKRKRIGKQKGGFLPLLAAVAPTAIDLMSKIIAKWRKEEIG